MLRTYQIPYVITVHSDYARLENIGDSLRRFALYNSSAAIFVSRFIMHKLSQRYSLNTPCAVIENGIDFHIAYQEDTNLFNCKNNRYLSFCGRLNKNKGLGVLLKAFATVREKSRFRDLKLVIAGEGDQYNQVRELIRVLQLEDAVLLCGYVDNFTARSIINGAVLHIVPSEHESFGMSAIEGMAEGKCVIASKVEGLKELINDQQTGVFCEPNNPVDLACRIEFLLDNPDKRERIGKKAQQKVLRYSWESVAHRTLDIYENILNSQEVTTDE